VHSEHKIVVEVDKELFADRFDRNDGAPGDVRCALTKAALG
jgi:hypothetical protein